MRFEIGVRENLYEGAVKGGGTLLSDHLAGAGFAIDLLQAMKERQVEKPDDQFVESLLAMVEEDRDTLQQLADKIGSGPNVLKELTAWIGEKQAV